LWTVNPAQDRINDPRVYQLGTKKQPWGRQPEPDSDAESQAGLRTPTTSSGPKSILPSPIQELLPRETEDITRQVEQLSVLSESSTLAPHTDISGLDAIHPTRRYFLSTSATPDYKGKQPMSQTQQLLTIGTTITGSGSHQVQQPPAQPPGGAGGGGPAPGGGGPPGGGGGGGGPPGGGPAPAGAAAGVAGAAHVGGTNGHLRGVPPKPYGGKRGEAEAFLQRFKLFKNANRSHPTMTNPFERTNFMLTFCEGTAINEWAAQQGDLLAEWVIGDVAHGQYPTRLDTDETIWTDTVQALKDAFREYHKGETAHRELKKLRQEPGRVEDYITSFQTLLRRSGWTTTDNGTIEAFREGLLPGVLTACHSRSTKPRTLEEWYEAARVEEKSYYDLQSDLTQAKQRRKGGGFSRLGEMTQDAKGYRKRPRQDVDPRPYVAMQVDAVRMSDQERQKLLRQKACFRCKKTGHFSKDCPSKPKGPKGKQKGPMKPKPRARAAETGEEEEPSDKEDQTEEINDSPPAYAKKDLMAAIKKMKIEDREELLDQCALDSDQDF